MRRQLRKGKKITAESARRITGISTPFGGLQWADPGPSEAEIIRRFLVFLEDRRVLYNAYHLEVVSEVENSIHQIREQCTKTLQQLSPQAFAVTPIKSIRAAGRRFHDDQNEEFRFFDHQWDQGRHMHAATPAFFTALGVYRATIGHQVALLVAHYDIDIEGDLASVLPLLEEADE